MITVNNEIVEKNEVSVRAMNFSQHFRTKDTVPVGYNIFFSWPELYLTLEKILDELVEDIKIVGIEDKFYSQISKQKKPIDLASLVSNFAENEIFLNNLTEFGIHECMVRNLGEGSNNVRYILNTIDNTKVTEEGVAVSGTGIKNQPGLKYQDR